MNSLVRNILLIFFVMINYSFSQTLHTVSLVGMTFSPDEVTIIVGDTVKWTNNGGLHNVMADDNSFTSGAPSTSIWTFLNVFNSIGSFMYYCSEHGAPNGIGMSGKVNVESSTDVNDEVSKMDYVLNQNYPNPYNPSTTIQYSIPQNEYVNLKIYNVTGSLEKVLISENQPAGNYIIEFNASELASGVYFYQLIAGDFTSTKRMILLK